MSGRCVLAVHAHPDDESSKGAATMAMYASQGVRTVLVTCTGGEAGEVVDRDVLAAGEDLATVRRQELAEAVAALGYASTYLLGYPDSGMAGEVEGGFATGALEEVVDRLVAIFRAERPDVVVTYDEDYAVGHPDHWRCHEATVLAFEQAGEPGWGPAKLYGIRTHSPRRLAAMHAWLTGHGLASPYGPALANAGTDRTTTRINVAGHLPLARKALSAHRSQVRADEPWFFAVPVEAMAKIHPWEDYQLLRPQPAAPDQGNGFESDLFAGLG